MRVNKYENTMISHGQTQVFIGCIALQQIAIALPSTSPPLENHV
ncbi:MAG: hypothetical protein AB3A66_21560 [Nodularia sp. CChRGM 3473]